MTGSRYSAMLLGVLCFSSPLLVGASSCGGNGTPQCGSDQDCADESYCNGLEMCQPAHPSADSRGCVRVAVPACVSGSVCLDSESGCVRVCAPHETSTPSNPCVAQCAADRDCQDYLFCNGAERCMPGGAGADARGCMADTTHSACGAGQICDEAADRCETTCAVPADADRDGHRAVECFGDDCDDHDPNRFPGNNEVCDFDGHDEDCDTATHGSRDEDHDGFLDSRCCNGTQCESDCNDSASSVHPNQPEVCNGIDDNCVNGVDEGVTVALHPDLDLDGYGTSASVPGCPGTVGYSTLSNDCDDTNPAIQPGAMICDPAVSIYAYSICQSDGSYLGGKCSGSVTCHSEPNGLGFCY